MRPARGPTVKPRTEGYFNGHRGACPLELVDKPGRRKRQAVPWGKVAAVVLVGVIAVGVGWEVYWSYIYRAPPQYARIDTTDGAIYVELFPACAPKTVSNFDRLVGSGFYNDLVWHRIVPGFVIQTGDPYSKGGLNSTRGTWGEGGSNATVPLEVKKCPDLGTYAGYLAMARKGNLTTGYDTGTSQFFINLSNSSSNLQLIGYYTVFGKVIEGMSVVNALGKSTLCVPPSCPTSWQPDEPLPPVFVNDIVMLQGPPG